MGSAACTTTSPSIPTRVLVCLEEYWVICIFVTCQQHDITWASQCGNEQVLDEVRPTCWRSSAPGLMTMQANRLADRCMLLSRQHDSPVVRQAPATLAQPGCDVAGGRQRYVSILQSGALAVVYAQAHYVRWPRQLTLLALHNDVKVSTRAEVHPR